MNNGKKLKIFGYESPISVLNNIKQEFVNQGWELVDDGPVDLIFHTTGFFDKAIEYYNKYPQGIKIFNLLDANPTDPNWPEERAAEELSQAHVRTTISETAKKQIVQRTGVEDIHIIGYPMLPTISNLNFFKGVEFLWVGRISGTKRFNLMVQTLKTMGVDYSMLAVVGPEKPPVGTYVGVFNQNDLNELYNSSRFVFLTSSSEGLGLPAIEACCSGGFPIVCNDNPVVYELGLEDFAADPDPVEIARKVNQIVCNKEYYQEKIKSLALKYQDQFSVKTFVQNVLTLYNASK